MDKSEALRLAKKYSAEVKKTLNPSDIFLFGSYSNGVPHEWSDIDVAVIFDGFDGDFLETSALLWKLRRNVSDEIEPHLLDKRNDNIGFATEIIRTGTPV